MKMTLTILFGLVQFCAMAQDYQILRSTDVHYFMADDYDSDFDPILAVRIDSFHVLGADTLLFPFKTIRENPNDLTGSCDFFRSGSWIGNQVIIENDGTNIILNQAFDSVYIETMAQLNDSFLVYKYDTGDSIIGTVTAVEELSFLGFTDSIKTITLTSNSGIFNLTSNKIRLSKNHGIYELFPFYTFPNAYDSVFNVSDTYTLCGQDYPKLGITRPTHDELNHLEIGDEYFMVNRYYSDYVHSTIDSSRYTLIQKTLQLIDTVSYYAYLYQVDTYKKYVEVNTFVFPYDTIEHNVYYQHLFDTNHGFSNAYTSPYLPGESVTYSNGTVTAISTFDNRYSATCGYNFSETVVVVTIPVSDTSNCFAIPVDPSQHKVVDKHLISGTNSYYPSGGPGGVSGFSSIYETFHDYEYLDSVQYNQLVYKKNSGVVCGEMPVTFIGLPQNSMESTITVYPNPTNGLVQIKSEMVWDTYRLLSITGAEVARGAMTNTLDIAEYPTGIYILEIRSANQIFRIKISKY